MGADRIVTEGDILAGLSRMGICPGDRLIVHSSLKSFGRVEGGAGAVVRALMRAVTGEGTLVMPSFNHEQPYHMGDIFDIASTPTINGAIPDFFWRQDGVRRSMNPTHPFAVWGRDTARYVSGHEWSDAMGVGSPIYHLLRDGGSALLLGVGYTSNTFHHYVETATGAPCLRGRGEEYPVRYEDGREGRARTWSWRAGHCPIDDTALYAPLMAPHERRATIGECEAVLFGLNDCLAVVSRALAEGAFGCPPCSECGIRPRVCESTVPD